MRVAASIPYPDGYDSHKYSYRGRAYFFAPFGAWGVLYEHSPGESVAIGSGAYTVWIDDATGKFLRYGYGH